MNVHIVFEFSTIVLYMYWLKMFSVTSLAAISSYAASRAVGSVVMPSAVQHRALNARMGASGSRP